MADEYRLKTPLSEESVRKLKLGDMVYLDGEMTITAGLPTHQRIMDCIETGEPPPIGLENSAFFHLGSYSRETDDNYEILYINPTTSTRFNPYMPTLIETFGLRAVGGKGGLGRESVDAMERVGCVYLAFLGGGCPILSAAIKEVIAVGWKDLIFHYRLTQLKIEGLGPLTVAIDSHGNSIYERTRQEAEKNLPDILKTLEVT